MRVTMGVGKILSRGEGNSGNFQVMIKSIFPGVGQQW